MKQLPNGWAETPLFNIVAQSLGGDWGKECKDIGDGFEKVSVVRGTEFKTWKTHRAARAAQRCIKKSSLKSRQLAEGDIVVEISGGGPTQPVGRTILIDKAALNSSPLPLVCSNFFRQIRLHEMIDSAYVNHFLGYTYSKGAFDEFQTQTTNLRNLNFKRFLDQVTVDLAPLNEQRRIVAKLEKLLGSVETAQTRLTTIPSILKRFRQSVLSAACSGELTADWRQRNGASGEWPVHSLSELGSVSGGITKNAKRPVMDLRKPYLRVANVYENRLVLDQVLEIGLTEQEFLRTRLRKHDVLFVEGNGSVDQIGRVALWDGSIEDCVHQNHLIKFRANGTVLPAFVLLQMMSPNGRAQLVEKATSSAGLNTLSISKISAVRVPLAIHEEQQEIVRRVEALFKTANALEARYLKAKAYVDKLTQSILAKAFRGELVPQDPTDEPASVLLGRVREARNGTHGDASPKKNKRKVT